MTDRILKNLKYVTCTFLLLTTPYLFAQEGVLDTGFGTNGIVKTDFNNLYEAFDAIAIQADGKILVVGGSGPGNVEAIIIRYNEDGNLDTTFGTNGIGSYSFSWSQI